jgi:hypothetical protein
MVELALIVECVSVRLQHALKGISSEMLFYALREQLDKLFSINPYGCQYIRGRNIGTPKIGDSLAYGQAAL